MANKAENLNQAIVNKLDSILANTNCTTEVKIEIEAKVGVAPHIKYQIEELIVVDDSEDND